MTVKPSLPVQKLNYSSVLSVGKLGRWKIFYIVVLWSQELKGMCHNAQLCKYSVEKRGNIQAIFYFSKLMGCRQLTYKKNHFLEVVHQKKATEKFILGLSDGYVEPNNSNDYSQGFSYGYSYVDHIGNIRLTYADIDGNGTIDPQTEIIETKDFYPFGMSINYGDSSPMSVVSADANSAARKFGFGGKEHQDELGLNWIDITARNYNPEIGRWMNIDPLAEEMRRHSPYNYAFDNPVYFIDPDGMKPFGIVKDRERRVNSSRTNTYGTVNYSRTVRHTGSARGYKTIYEKNFTGNDNRYHDHTFLEVRGNFSGTAITESSTTSNADTGGIGGLVTGIPNLADISDTAKITTSKVAGQFFDSDGNKVDSAENASSLVVTTKTVEEAVDLSSDLTNLPESATVTRTDTTTTYSLSHGKYGTIELNQTDQVSTSRSETISFDDATKDLKNHTFNTVKKNIETRGDVVNFHNDSFKDFVDELGND